MSALPRRRSRIFGCIAMLGLAVAGPGADSARAAVYTVDAATGRDDNPGTAERPWRTIGTAAGTVLPGDTVRVRAGAYDERVVLGRSGTPAAPILFEAEGQVRLRGFSIRADDIRVRGFVCESSGPPHQFDSAGIAVAGRRVIVEGNTLVRTAFYGILLDPASRDCRVVSNHCRQTAMAGIMVQGTGHWVDGNEIEDTRVAMAGNTYNDADGIRVFGAGHTLRGNYIHGITLEANRGFAPHIDGFQNWYIQGAPPLADCTFERNLIILPIATATTHASGFMLDGDPTRLRIRNNLVRAGRGVHVARGAGNRILNNTVVGDLDWPVAGNPAGLLLETGSDMVVRNNIVYDFPGPSIHVSKVTGLTSGHNCVYRTDGRTPNGTPQPGDLWGRDPAFVSAAAGDFRLRPESPCIDAGAPDPAVTDDFEGSPRPYGRGPDIGCYEFRPVFSPLALFTAQPRAGTAPLRVVFDATPSYDPDGWIAALAWDFGDGAGAGGWRTEHTYEQPGSYTVTLLVKDDAGLESRMTDSIRVIGGGQDKGGVIAKPWIGRTPLRVTMSAATAVSAGAEPAEQCHWDFGDGGSASGRSVTHVYTAPGLYTIRLTLSDAARGRRVLTARIWALAGPPAVPRMRRAPGPPPDPECPA
jgi:chitodextrinase